MTPQQQIEQQIKAVTDTVGRVVSALTGFLLSLPLLGTAITAVIGVIGGFGLALRSATGEAMALARSLSQMRAANGYSFAQGYGIQRQYGAIGISQSDTTGLFSQAGNSAFGFASRGANPRDLAALAAQYQATASQGVFGRQFANSRLDQQFGGNVPASLREALSNFSPSQIRGNQAFSDRINGSLGIDPNVLKEYATTLPLVQARIGAVVDAIRVKFAVTLLPLVEKVLGGIADYLAANADKIGETIRRVGEWILALPAILMRFGAGILRGFAGVLDGFGGFLDFLSKSTPAIAGLFDSLGNSLLGLANVVSGVVGQVSPIIDGARQQWENRTGVPGAARGAAETVDKVTGGNGLAVGIGAFLLRSPIIAGIGGLLKWGAGAMGIGGGGAAAPFLAPGGAPNAMLAAVRAPVVGLGVGLGLLGTEVFRRFRVAIGDKNAPDSFGELMSNVGRRLGIIGDPAGGDNSGTSAPVAQSTNRVLGRLNLAGNSNLLGTISGALGSGASGARSGAEMLRDVAGNLDKGAASWNDEIKEILKSIDKRAAETADNTSKAERSDDLQQMAQLISRFGSRVASYIAEDNALNVLRTG